MAEQAINTIYLLGEQPDSLCSLIIKNLTTRVFDQPSSSTLPPSGDDSMVVETQDETPSTPTPMPKTPSGMSRSSSNNDIRQDQAGSFSLAQLVFIVGHVSIKHIVYLELVEREFKRRKDETAKRTSMLHI